MKGPAEGDAWSNLWAKTPIRAYAISLYKTVVLLNHALLIPATQWMSPIIIRFNYSN